jgi:opacity protein-like surface antigen
MSAALPRWWRSLLLAALALPSVGWAQPYVTAKLGYASGDFSLGEPYNGVVDDSSVAYGFDVGFGFGRNVAIEFGADGYSSFDGRATPCPPGEATCPQIIRPTSGNDVTTYTLAIVPRYSFERVELFARAGMYRADIDTNLGFGDDEFRERGLVLGAGARWYFSEPWSVSLHASRFDDKLYQFAVGVGWGLPAGMRR